MKYTLIILLVITSHYMAPAQNKNNLYIDIGVNERGFSATYDKKLTRHFDVGLGINTYNLYYETYGSLRSACYLDIRPYWAIRRSLLFMLADVGLAIIGGRERTDATISHLGLYTAFGFGYCYRINKRGMGPYLSIGLNGTTLRIHYLDPPPRPDYRLWDAFGILSIGFKF